MEGKSMTIHELITGLRDIADNLPKGFDSQVVVWTRVPHAEPIAVLEVSTVAQGYRITHGGEVAMITSDQLA